MSAYMSHYLFTVNLPPSLYDAAEQALAKVGMHLTPTAARGVHAVTLPGGAGALTEAHHETARRALRSAGVEP